MFGVQKFTNFAAAFRTAILRLRMNILSQIGNIPLSTRAIGDLFPDIKSTNKKVGDLQKAGHLIRLKQGLYVVSPDMNGKPASTELIANHLYGPSYISMQTALRHYGLIPETVYETQSMTIKHSRSFNNQLGRFSYIFCPRNYFAIGIQYITITYNNVLMATPEKALCDTLCYTPNLNIRYKKELSELLEEDWRFDMDALRQMDTDIIRQCAENGKKRTTILQLIKLISQ